MTVATGKVQVQTAGRMPAEAQTDKQDDLQPKTLLQTTTLTSGQQALYNVATSQIEKRAVDLENYLGWKEGVIRFEEASLADAIKILERWYDVTITLDDAAMAHCTISGVYKDGTLVDILESFKFIGKIDYVINDKNNFLLTKTNEWAPCRP